MRESIQDFLQQSMYQGVGLEESQAELKMLAERIAAAGVVGENGQASPSGQSGGVPNPMTAGV